MSDKRVQCPNCGRPVEWKKENRWRPFCSERCRMVDLAGWIDESRRIPGEGGAESIDDWAETCEELPDHKYGFNPED